MLGSLRMAQTISIALIVAALVILIYRRTKQQSEAHYLDQAN
jgi:phosphatidylglycerol:prolipoprotein diacylglycerol transferase